MLYQSTHIRVTAEYGTATLWLGFPGGPANALDAARLQELDAALGAVAANRSVGVLVVRSATPAGFCAGLHPDAVAGLSAAADRAAFAWYGQSVTARLAALDAVSVAFVDGPCLGAGLELALACDRRLCVARPTTHLGFPGGVPTCLGGAERLARLAGRRVAARLLAGGRTLSGREAKAAGLVDHAFCERRAKIELRSYLDRLESNPVKRWAGRPVGGESMAAERRAFAAWEPPAVAPAFAADPPPVNPVPPFPAVVGLVGDDETFAGIVADAVLRGAEAVTDRPLPGIAVALARGFVTPLEADQTRKRVAANGPLARAGLVLVSGPEQLPAPAALPPRAVVLVAGGRPPVPGGFPHPRRVCGVRLAAGGVAELHPTADTDSDTLAAAAAWLAPFGWRASLAAAEPLPVRAAA